MNSNNCGKILGNGKYVGVYNNVHNIISALETRIPLFIMNIHLNTGPDGIRTASLD